MASFFSLQPSQESPGNLSKFASATPGLEHVGSSQTYLDPSGKSGETLHSPFDEPGNTATSGARGGNLMTPVGDDGGGVDTGGTSAQTGARTPTRPQQQMQQQPQNPMSPSQIQALQTIGGVQQGLSTIPKSFIDSIKSTLKSSPEGANMSDSDIDSFIQSLSGGGYTQTLGGLDGTEYYEALNPSQTEGFSLSADTNLDTDWLNSYVTGVRPGDKTLLDKFALGDVQSALGVGSAAITGDPAAILSSLNRAAPTVAKYITDNQDILKDVGSLASVAGGAWSLYNGIQSNNPAQIAGGLGQLLQGAGTSRVGLDVLSQLTGASSGAIANAFGAVGGLTGAFSLYQAIESGDPVQAILSAASIYGALSTIAPSVFTPLTTLAANALVAVAPQVAASLGIQAGTSILANTGALVGAVAPVLGVAAVVVAAVTSWISANEESEARRSGWWNNPIAGQLYSSATAGVGSANKMLDRIDAAGISTIPTDTLMQGLPSIVDSLMPYYATAQGGAGALKASGTAGSPGAQSEAEYTANFTKARDRMEDIVDELLRRGVTWEQLGKLPVSYDWSLESLDAGGRPQDILLQSPKISQYMTEGGGMYGTLGYRPTAGQNTQNQVDLLLAQALGASQKATDQVTHAGGLYAAMYGGPLQAALARMGSTSDPRLREALLSQFDPWRIARTWAPGSRAQEHHVVDINGAPLDPLEWGQYGTA